jgi:hypothetical protein
MEIRGPDPARFLAWRSEARTLRAETELLGRVDFDSWFVVVFVVAGGYVLVAGGRTPAGESSSTA